MKYSKFICFFIQQLWRIQPQHNEQHKVVEEQLHLAATMWTSQVLKEPLQRAALDIALGARAAKSSVQTLNTQDLIQDLRQEHKVPLY